MGKAYPKTCSVCFTIISGANWAKHKSRHPGGAVGTIYRGTKVPKNGRPSKGPKRHRFDTPENVKLIGLRGPALVNYTRNKLTYSL